MNIKRIDEGLGCVYCLECSGRPLQAIVRFKTDGLLYGHFIVYANSLQTVELTALLSRILLECQFGNNGLIRLLSIYFQTSTGINCLHQSGFSIHPLGMKKVTNPSPLHAIDLKNSDWVLSDQLSQIDSVLLKDFLLQAKGITDVDEKSIETAYMRRDYNFFISHQGRLIGGVSVLTIDSSTAWISGLLVHPNYQGQGLGQFLMKQAIKKSDRDTILLTTQKHHDRFFEQMGFRKQPNRFGVIYQILS